jgi:hypothetical protein
MALRHASAISSRLVCSDPEPASGAAGLSNRLEMTVVVVMMEKARAGCAPAMAPPSPFQALLSTAVACASASAASRSLRSSGVSRTKECSNSCGQLSRALGFLFRSPCAQACLPQMR